MEGQIANTYFRSMCMGVFPACTSVHHMNGVRGSRKTVLEALELVLQAVEPTLGTGN